MKEFSGTESILIVDDEQILTELAAEILGDAGYEVAKAFNGEDALKALSERNFDLLFTDIIMPGMTGYRLVNEVIEKYPDIKILLTSGYQIRNQHQSVPEELLTKVVTKPYGDRKLLKAIRECLDA